MIRLDSVLPSWPVGGVTQMGLSSLRGVLGNAMLRAGKFPSPYGAEI